MYAQCEDDFNRVEVNYINSMGRMAEVTGEEMIYTDLRMKLFIDPEEVKKEYENSPKWLKELMQGFADGINYYLYTHPDVKPKLITQFEPWMALTFSEGSIGGDIESISTRGLESFYGRNIAMATFEEDIIDPDQEPRGSNGFAIAPTLTASGNALLLINPHTSFFFRPEVHMVSEEGLNAYGAVTWGQFFVYQGFNEKCGWMHTSSRADVIDLYLETIIEKDGNYFYKYGEEERPLIIKTIDVAYKSGDTLLSHEFTAYFTHHGPVVRREDEKWVAVSLMVEHEKALTQSFLRTKARSYEDFSKVMELKTNSSNNTVYADGDGNIAYWHGNFMPVRDRSFDFNGTVDGSNPATDWKGLHDVKDMITILNPGTGWIQNCNSTPFTASGPDSPRPDDYPPYMAPDEENARGIHAVMVLENQSEFTLDKLITAAYDSYLPAFTDMIPSLVKHFDNLKPAEKAKYRELKDPVELLRKWDIRFGYQSVETTLAVYFGQEITSGLRVPESARSTSLFDYIAQEVPSDQMIAALASAVLKLKSDFGTWMVPWGEVNRFQRISGEINHPFNDDKPSLPVNFTSSRWGSLASFGARQYPGNKEDVRHKR